MTPPTSQPPPSGLFVCLGAEPNPDFAQDSHNGSIQIDPRWVPAASLVDARRQCERFRDESDLGGGNWTGGHVALDGVVIARVSYNGRIWEPGPAGKLTPELSGTEDPKELLRRFG